MPAPNSSCSNTDHAGAAAMGVRSQRGCALSTAGRHAVLYAVALAALTACEDVQAPAESATESVIARSENAAITLEEARAAVALRLYDLELQQFRTLREATEATILARLDAGAGPPIAELSLAPPLPPRLDVTADPARVRPARGGSETRPVSLVVFCDFESSHCARLQTRLDRLRQLYAEVLEIGTRDLTLSFHRDAERAAAASRCAQEQGAYWAYHDALYAGTGALARERLDWAALVAGLDAERFAACLESGRWLDAVSDESAFAASLGLDAVPAVFVNGLYAGPEPGTDQMIWLIEHELALAGVVSPRERASTRSSELELPIQALVHSSEAGQGFVLATALDGSAQIVLLREGDALAPTVSLRRVTATGLELLHDGRSEVLPFTERGASRAPAAANGETPIVTPHIAVPVTIDRDEVRVRLSDRAGLAEVLEPVALRAGDYRLVRIREVEPDSLYALLGLEAGDVIVGVNEEPAHEGDMPLWRALETEDEVRVRVMRDGGVAQHFTYRFDE
jgi:protein-disulfide isomerase/type II secretory pathway component PulC